MEGDETKCVAVEGERGLLLGGSGTGIWRKGEIADRGWRMEDGGWRMRMEDEGYVVVGCRNNRFGVRANQADNQVDNQVSYWGGWRGFGGKNMEASW